MLKAKPWHSLFFAAFPAVFLYSQNIEMVMFSDVIKPLTIILGLAIVLLVILRFVFKSWVKSGLLTSLIMVLALSFGPYYEYCYTWEIPFYPKNIRWDHNFYKWTSLCLILLVSWRLKKSKSKLLKINSLLNFVSVILLLFSAYSIMDFKRKEAKMEDAKFEEVMSDTTEGIQSFRPTIYYLVMDAYTRNDVLQEYFNFDNSEFTNYLKDKGFYVADKAISNYGQTVLSIPSALNMQYLDSVISVLGEKHESRWPMAKVLNNNKVLNTLKKQKYKSISFDASIFEVVYLKDVDVFHQTPGTKFSLYQNELINMSVIRAFNRRKRIVTASPEEFHRKKILEAFNVMGRIPAKSEPYYVHGHILAPHQPFLFDKDGNHVDAGYDYNIWRPFKQSSDNSAYKKGYIGQLQFVNKKLTELIDKILSESKIPPIIIIQGDHGSCSELRNHMGFEDNDFKERFSIMNAYYFPDQDYSMLYDSISPVNSFKVVMNKYFNGKYELEEDKALYSDWAYPYLLYDVTDSIK
ncbi:MAG: hypothetical protein JJ975_12060 [Bacteroidia bacterium]|nr:hypothetical protein [Bacteroidia bacterium]